MKRVLLNENDLRRMVNYAVKTILSEGNNGALYHNKPFWIGSVSLLDGEIEEVHTFEEAEDCDFHHTFVFSSPQVEKINNEENAIFWIDDGKIQGTWRVNVPQHIIQRIRGQIKIL